MNQVGEVYIHVNFKRTHTHAYRCTNTYKALPATALSTMHELTAASPSSPEEVNAGIVPHLADEKTEVQRG